VVRNVPVVNEVRGKWDDAYLSRMFGSQPRLVEYSGSNSFMYWHRGAAMKTAGFVPPTKEMYMTFDEWRERSEEIGASILDGSASNTEVGHYYFRVSSDELAAGPANSTRLRSSRRSKVRDSEG
jgi:hypothetical protein